MKKLLLVLATIALVCSFFSGCSNSSTNKGPYINKEYNEESMKTISGKEISTDDCLLVKTAGLGFVLPESWANITGNGDDPYPYEPYALLYYFMPETWVDKVLAIPDDASDEEYIQTWQEAYSHEYSAFAIFRVDSEDSESKAVYRGYQIDYENCDEVAVDGNTTYYFAWNPAPDWSEYSEAEQADAKIIADSIEEIKNSLVLFTPTDPLEDFLVDVTSFSAEDINGNAVDASIFADYDVTMINCWTTWCQYCIAEMPDIEKIYQDLPENMNIIGICFDASTEKETAIELIKQTGITYTTIVGNAELSDKIETYVAGYPTTFFVNSKGEVIGELVVGAYVEEYQRILNELAK